MKGRDKMLMEIYLDEDKAKKYDIDIEHCYDIIDNYFHKRGVEKIGKGIYRGIKKDFTTFACMQGQLPQTDWFLKIVDQWYISYFGDEPDSPEYRANALETYYRVKKRNERYYKKQKSTQF